VLGAGHNGHELHSCRAAGYKVIMRDMDMNAVARVFDPSSQSCKGNPAWQVTEEDRDDTLQRIRGTAKLEDTRGADLFIEGCA